MLDYNSSLTALTLLLTVLIFSYSIVLRRRTTVQSALLAELKNKLDRDEEEKNREQDFQTSLQQAEITTELQKSRSVVVHSRNNRKTPERYQYAQSMFQSGMHTDEISSALGMSTTEITQLLKLARITCKAE